MADSGIAIVVGGLASARFINFSEVFGFSLRLHGLPEAADESGPRPADLR